MVPLIGSALLTEEQTTLLNIYRIASRLIFLVKVMGQQGEAIGPMDLREFYLRNSDDGEQYLVAGPLLYASTDGTPFLTQPAYTAAIPWNFTPSSRKRWRISSGYQRWRSGIP